MGILYVVMFQVNEEPEECNGFASDLQAKVKSSNVGVGTAAYAINNISSAPYIGTANDELSDTSDESDVDVCS